MLQEIEYIVFVLTVDVGFVIVAKKTSVRNGASSGMCGEKPQIY